MTFSHIHTPARFNQKADFSNILLPGTDVDFFTEIDDKFYVLVEWKSRNVVLPMGQSIGFNRLANDLGKVKPTFHLIAYHTTETKDSIHGDNSFVRQVIYRLPNMSKQQNYFYKSEVPTVNQWLADFSYEFRVQKVLSKGCVPVWEGVPVVGDDLDGIPVIGDDCNGIPQTQGPSAFFDQIRPKRHAYEYH